MFLKLTLWRYGLQSPLKTLTFQLENITTLAAKQEIKWRGYEIFVLEIIPFYIVTILTVKLPLV